MNPESKIKNVRVAIQRMEMDKEIKVEQLDVEENWTPPPQDTLHGAAANRSIPADDVGSATADPDAAVFTDCMQRLVTAVQGIASTLAEGERNLRTLNENLQAPVPKNEDIECIDIDD